jgi:RhoGEF domain
LLLGASATPNRVPNYLAGVLPLISDTLLALDISANFLTSLPPALVACTNLEELNIGSNPLRAIPTWLGALVSLRVLIVDSTGIVSLPTSLSGLVQLHTLSIRWNRMYSLPSWLCLLPALEALYVEGNPYQGPWKALLEPLVPQPVVPPLSAQLHPPNTPFTANSMASSGTASSGSEYLEERGQQLSSTAGNPVGYDDRTITNTNAIGTGHPPVATVNTAPWQQDATVQRGSIAAYSRPHISIAASANTRPRDPSETLHARPNTTHGEDSLGHRRKLSRTKTTPTRRVERPVSFLGSHLHNQLQALEPGGGAEAHMQHQRVDSSRDVIVRMQQPPEMDPHAPPSPVRRMKSAGDIKPGFSGRPAAKSMHESSPSKSNVLGDNPPESRFRSLGSRGRPKPDHRPLTATLFDTSRSLRGPKDHDKEKDKEKSKWGFLKKISTSVGRPRTPVESERTHWLGPPRQMGSPLQNSMTAPTGGGLGVAPAGLRSTVSLHSTQTSPPRRLTKKPSTSTLSVAHASTATLMPPGPNPASAQGPMGQKGSLPAAALSTPNLLTPTNPPLTPRSQKRRSFLPVDGPGPITIPGPLTSNTIIVADHDGQYDRGSNTQPEGIASIYYSPSPYDDERERERHVRALRSVMAYLRDMCDLNAGTSQGAAAAAVAAAKARNVVPLSMTQTPDQPRVARSRGPTLGSADASQALSEFSFSTTTSSTGFGTGSPPMSMFSQNPASMSFSPTSTVASIGLAAAAIGLNKPTSFGDRDSGGGGNRDSSGSSHNLDEKKYKDEKGKRAMIVKEIVTYVLCDTPLFVCVANLTYSTERTYVKGMQELVDIYVKPASAPVTVIGSVSTKETVVPAGERKVVFNGLESLLSFHKESFLPSLDKAYASLEHSADEDGEASMNAALAVARVFVSHAAFMRMYSTYIK